jgi:hypothetical protein
VPGSTRPSKRSGVRRTRHELGARGTSAGRVSLIRRSSACTSGLPSRSRSSAAMNVSADRGALVFEGCVRVGMRFFFIGVPLRGARGYKLTGVPPGHGRHRPGSSGARFVPPSRAERGTWGDRASLRARGGHQLETSRCRLLRRIVARPLLEPNPMRLRDVAEWLEQISVPRVSVVESSPANPTR